MRGSRYWIVFLILFGVAFPAAAERASDFGIRFGSMKSGTENAITDVEGVRVGQVSLVEGEEIRTGVTVILPHGGNVMLEKVPAAIYIANGFGKMTGYSQVEELGNIETPIVLTNTLSVPTAADALIDYVLDFAENRDHIRSINPVVGETNDGFLNDIQGRHVKKEHVLEAIAKASFGPVAEGAVGAGTGTTCFGYKGGIGTSSRMIPKEDGGFTIGVLVQTNFGGSLTIAGIPMKRELGEEVSRDSGDGSCMIIVATDAPITSRNLKRMAKRALFGLARTGGNCSNGSGEYVIAFSTFPGLRIPHHRDGGFYRDARELRNDRMTPLFEAVIEATEEAVINSLFAAESMTGLAGHEARALPVRQVVSILKEHGLADED